MITKEQLAAMNGRGELHYDGTSKCQVRIGSRGGRYSSITKVRLSGKLKTWKRDPQRFHQPIKYGMWINMYIDNRNAADFHLACDCPASRK